MKSEIIKTHFNKKNEIGIEFDLVPLKSIKHIIEKKMKGRYERLDFNMIVHFTKGEGFHHIDFNSYKYKEGTSFYLSRYQVQKWELNRDTDGFLILFTDNFFNTSEYDRKLLLDLEIALQGHPEISKEKNPFILESLNILKREFAVPKDSVKEEILRSQIRILLLHLLRDNQQLKKGTIFENDTELFKRFRHSLESNYLTMRTVAEYANQCGVGQKKLNQVIQKISGTTAKKYIDNRIILESKRLLSSTCDTTQEAAFALEFDDPSNFVKFFKRYTGVTPSQFQSSI